MKCEKCKLEIEQYYSGNFCKRCFCDVIERRIRKRIRLEELIEKNDTLIIDDDLCLHVIKEIVQGMPIIIKKSGAGKSAKGKKVLPSTMDDEINAFMGILFSGKDIKKEFMKERKDNKEIKLFANITDNELDLYAAAKGIKLKKGKKETKICKNKETYKNILDELEKKHHETRTSIYNSLNELKRILNQ